VLSSLFINSIASSKASMASSFVSVVRKAPSHSSEIRIFPLSFEILIICSFFVKTIPSMRQSVRSFVQCFIAILYSFINYMSRLLTNS